MRFLVLILSCVSAWATFDIPSSNRVDWTVHAMVGVQGGIPTTNTVVFTNMVPGDTDVELNAAIAAYTSSTTRVIYLPAGSYAINAAVTLRSNIVIRGAGISNTVLIPNPTTVINCFVTVAGTQSTFAANGLTALNKGDSNATFTSVSGMAVGRTIQFSQTYETNLVWSPDAADPSDGTRWWFQRRMITAINANTVTFWPPLEYPLYASLTPVERHETSLGPRNIGVESLSIDGTGGTNGTRIQWRGAANVWVKDVEFKAIGSRGIAFSRTMFSDVANCNFKGQTYAAGTGLGIAGGSAGLGSNGSIYIYNNWFYGVRNPIFLEQMTYCVIAYNFTTNSGDGSINMTDGALEGNHAAHNAMCLFEGNVSENFQMDPSHGSSSHETLFRNQFTTLNATQTSFLRAIDPNRVQLYVNAVGNVLGHQSKIPYQYYDFPITNGVSATNRTIYRLGAPNQGSTIVGTNDIYVGVSGGASNDVRVAETILRTANYDYFNQAIVYDPAYPDHDLPPSFYLTSRPDWFGFISWPPVDPSTPTLRTAQIPAMYRYLNGSEPGPALTATVGGNSVIGGNAILK